MEHKTPPRRDRERQNRASVSKVSHISLIDDMKQRKQSHSREEQSVEVKQWAVAMSVDQVVRARRWDREMFIGQPDRESRITKAEKRNRLSEGHQSSQQIR